MAIDGSPEGWTAAEFLNTMRFLRISSHLSACGENIGSPFPKGSCPVIARNERISTAGCELQKIQEKRRSQLLQDTLRGPQFFRVQHQKASSAGEESARVFTRCSIARSRSPCGDSRGGERDGFNWTFVWERVMFCQDFPSFQYLLRTG